MKHILLLAAMTFTLGLPLPGQGNEPRPKQITVIGSVELKEVADEASLSFSMKGVGSSLRDAVADANRKTLALTNRLLRIGLTHKDISTSQFYSGENYGDKAFLSSSRDFRAVLTTLIKVDSLPLIDTLLYAISDAEVENLSGITFSFRDELGLRRRARIAAAAKAREKAEDIATALGVALGTVTAIDEIEPTKTSVPVAEQSYLRSGRLMGYSALSPNPFNPLPMAEPPERTAVDESRGSGFFAQTISMTSQVRVTFEIK